MKDGLLILSREEVAAHLSYVDCIPLMRDAMIALSTGATRQTLRAIIDLDGGRAFGNMPGAMLGGAFGAKLISVFPATEEGGPSHRGVLVLFDPQTGAPMAIIDASELTALRTAAASAAATAALARPESRRLAILGTGEQAYRHGLAMAEVRRIEEIAIWGRSAQKAEALSARLSAELGLSVRASGTAAQAVAGADIVCTTTAASEPIFQGGCVADGTHLNVVGSSRLGPVEIDTPLVVRARFFADHREGVLRQGAEFVRAVEEGAIREEHLLGEIGEVMAGSLQGRTASGDITLYKSLGSIVQDLAAGWFLYEKALAEGFGTHVAF